MKIPQACPAKRKSKSNRQAGLHSISLCVYPHFPVP